MNDEKHDRSSETREEPASQVEVEPRKRNRATEFTDVPQSRVPSYPLVPDRSQGDCSKNTRGENLVTSDGPLAKQGPSFPFRASPKLHAEQKKEGKRPASVPKRVPKANLCRSSARIRHAQKTETSRREQPTLQWASRSLSLPSAAPWTIKIQCDGSS